MSRSGICLDQFHINQNRSLIDHRIQYLTLPRLNGPHRRRNNGEQEKEKGRCQEIGTQKVSSKSEGKAQKIKVARIPPAAANPTATN
jgi:hypothetical protein